MLQSRRAVLVAREATGLKSSGSRPRDVSVTDNASVVCPPNAEPCSSVMSSHFPRREALGLHVLLESGDTSEVAEDLGSFASGTGGRQHWL